MPLTSAASRHLVVWVNPRRKKKPGIARLSCVLCCSDQNVVAYSPCGLRQFRQRQFLNFDDCFNYVHDNPSFDGEHRNQVADTATMDEVSRGGEQALSCC